MSQIVDLRLCRSARDWRLFERVPELLHGDDLEFVPPIPGDVAGLGRTRHLFHADGTLTAWLAFRGGRPVGRVASIVNRTHNQFHGDAAGFFGFFSFSDEAVASRLMEQVRGDMERLGRTPVRGPFGPTQNDECGLQVNGFGQRPCYGMPYNPPWYPQVYEGLGLVGVRDYLAYELDRGLQERFDERLGPLVQRLRQRLDVTVRPVDLGRLDEEAALVSRLFNESLGEEWNFMPLSVARARRFAKDLAGHLDPESVLIAEVAGEPAGISIGLPDINEFLAKVKGTPRWLRLLHFVWLLKTRKCRRGRWAVFGMLPEFRRRGGTLLLVHEAMAAGREKYAEGELSWTQESNAEVNQLATQLGLVPARRYRIYETRP